MPINPDCLVCFGLGWVCENHPERAWDQEAGCQCGAGMPCECQHASGMEEPNTRGVIANDDTARWSVKRPRHFA